MSSRINYSQCWEDISLVRKALQINSHDRVLSITSGGDNSLSLLLDEPEEIVSLDLNPLQNYLAELKLQAAVHLDYADYLALLDVSSSDHRLKIFQSLKPHLSADARNWWSVHRRLVNRGLIHSGKFESYLNFFSRYMLPWVHSRTEIEAMLDQPNISSQVRYFHDVWRTWRWRLFFKLASSPVLLKKFARQDVMTGQDSGQTDSNYLRRLEEHLCRVPCRGNYYLHYCLRGCFGQSLPPYLEPRGYAKIRQLARGKISFVTTDILAYLRSAPAASFSKFNLSDIFESLTPENNDLLWSEILRVAKNGSRVMYWNNQLLRTPPPRLAGHFPGDASQDQKLHRLDRVFFYGSFHLKKIIK